MDIELLCRFFMWSSIINFVILTAMSVMCMKAADWIYSIHSKFFPISRNVFNTVLYCFIGFYKLMFFLFNLVPLVAIKIIA